MCGRWRRCQVEFYAQWAWLVPSWSQWNFCCSFQNQQDGSSAHSLFLLQNHSFLVFSGAHAHQLGIHTRSGFITKGGPDSFTFERARWVIFFFLANLDGMLQVCQRLLEFSLAEVWVKTAAIWSKLGCCFCRVSSSFTGKDQMHVQYYPSATPSAVCSLAVSITYSKILCIILSKRYLWVQSNLLFQKGSRLLAGSLQHLASLTQSLWSKWKVS